MNLHRNSAGHRHAFLTPARILRFALAAVLFILFFGYLVMLLWNALLPSLFSLHTISYWQGIGLLLLTRILIGGRPGPHRPGFARLGARPAWNEYEEWWRQVGRQSFHDFKASRPDDPCAPREPMQ
jgi:hypothetical protein